MALIDDIVAKVRAVPVAPDGSMTLSKSNVDVDFVQSFFDTVVAAPELVLRDASPPSFAAASVTVGGTTDFAGYAGVTLALTFAAVEDDVVATAVATLAPRSAPVALPVVSWISLDAIALTTTYSQPYGIVTLAFQANVVLDGDETGSIPIEVARLDASTWQIDMNEGATKSVAPKQLVALIGGHALTDLLPGRLVDLLEGFTINGLSADFDTSQKTVTYIATGFTVTNGWPVVEDKLELEPGLQILFTITDPLDADRRELIGIVKAKLMIGGVETPLFLQADVTAGTTAWVAGLDPESSGVTIPSLSDLFTLAGGEAFHESLPSGLRDLPGIDVSRLEVDFTLSPAAVQRFTFAAKTSRPWQLVEGFLEIKELDLALDLVNPGPNGKTGATIGGTFSITDSAWLFFVVDKAPDVTDWTLTGGLAPGRTFDLTDLVGSLLKDVAVLPPSVPALVFDTVQATVVPGKSVSFTAGSKTTWPLLPGRIELDGFSFDCAYDASSSIQPFTGSLKTAIALGGIDVSIAATVDKTGAWSFEGRTDPGSVIPVGELVTDLEQRFGVSGIPSTALDSLTIEDLDVRFAAGSAPGAPASFHLGCTGKMTLSENDLAATVAVDLSHGASGYTGAFTGTLTVARSDATTETFTFSISSDSKLKASWTAAEDHGLGLSDVAAAFGFDIPDGIPPELQLTLTKIVFDYDFGDGSMLFRVTTASGYEAILVSTMSKDSPPARLFAFGVDLPLGITLGDLPLIGDKLGGAQQLGIETLGFWTTSRPLVKADATLLNQVFGGFTPKLPDTDASARVYAFGELDLGTEKVPLQLSIGGTGSAPAPAASPAPPAGGPSAPPVSAPGTGAVTAAPRPGGPLKWFDVQRQLGVVQFKRIGVGYVDGKLTFALDVAVAVGPLELSLDGLSVASGLDSFSPTFHLSGLGLEYSEGPVTISGALLRLPDEELDPDTSWQFDGTVVIATGTFGIAALGSYAQLTSGQPSLFVFAQLEAPLGGPPALFVTGLMAGVGFNRDLTMPAQDEVSAFPLLALNQPPAPGSARPPRAAGYVLDVLEGRSAPPGATAKKWIAPRPGAYWLAVGLEFTSFELVHTRALLVAEESDGFQLSLLGLSTLQLPRPGDPGPTYAYAQLQLRAVFRPEEGYFGLTAVLTSSSYVIDPSCHLQGGFAFFVWFDPSDNAGQFVLTLGGYHPAFPAPAYFPQVPRLGFNWAVSDRVTIKGDAYFALTTTCVMAGGELQVMFHDGDLQAWLTAQADMLVSWNPFFYDVDIDISIGVSYRLNLLFTHTTISLSVGASLHLWGPPTAGTVTVHLWCVSFTVAFGSGSPDAATKPLAWSDFETLLPATADSVKVIPVAGLSGTLPGDGDGAKKWVVRARDFRFATQSAIPASHLRYGATAVDGTGVASVDYQGDNLDIRPMNKTGLNSVHRLGIRHGSSTADPVDPAGWTLAPWTQNVPESLWGAPPAHFTHVPAAPGAGVVPDQMVGYAVVAPRPRMGATRGVVPLKTLDEEELPSGEMPIDPTVAASGHYLAADAATTVAAVAGVGGDDAQQSRNAVHEILSNAKVYEGPNDSMEAMGGRAGELFVDSPMQPAAAGGSQ